MTKTTEQTKSSEPIRIDFHSVKQVVVTETDGDRFVTTSQEAALACRSALDLGAWKKEFDAFLAHINQWSKDRSSIVVRAYVGVSSEGLTVVIITKGELYRIDFDDEVTRLDIELANKFPACRADVLQSPESEPESRVPYISLDRAIQVYGD